MKISRYENRILLTKEEAAELLAVSVRKIEYMIEDGTLKGISLGYRTIRIRKNDVYRIVEKNCAIPTHSR